MWGLKNLFKWGKKSVESDFRDIYYSLINSVFDFKDILWGLPLVFVEDLPLDVDTVNPDFVYVLVRGSHPYYYLNYYYFDDFSGEWVEIDR